MATNGGEFLYNNALRLHKCDVISPWQPIEANLFFLYDNVERLQKCYAIHYHGIYFHMKMLRCHINVTHSSPWQPIEMAYCLYNNSARLHKCHANFSKRISSMTPGYHILQCKIQKNWCTVTVAGTNKRAPRWTFTDPCKPEVRPGAREESVSPAWLAAPAMNACHTTKVYIWRLDTGCGPTLYRKCHSHNTPEKKA